METLPVLLRPPVCLRPGSLSAVAAPSGAVKPAANSLQQPCKSHSGRPQGPIQACCLEPSACAHHPWFPTATPGLVPQPIPAPAPGVPFRPDVALIGGDKARGRLTAVDLQTGQLHTEQSESILRACMGAGECGTLVGLTFLWSPPDPDARPAAKSSDERNVCARAWLF